MSHYLRASGTHRRIYRSTEIRESTTIKILANLAFASRRSIQFWFIFFFLLPVKPFSMSFILIVHRVCCRRSLSQTISKVQYIIISGKIKWISYFCCDKTEKKMDVNQCEANECSQFFRSVSGSSFESKWRP